MHEIKIGEEELYPKFDLTDENGYALRDARFFQYVSRTISTFNKMAVENKKYQHYEYKEGM